MCGDCFPTPSNSLQHRLGVLPFNSILTLSTRKQHQIPRVKGSVPRDCLSLPLLPPLTYFRCHSKAQGVTCASNQPDRLELPMTFCSGSINLLERLTELRETFYSLDHWFMIKGYNSGTARWKRGIGQGVRKGHRASTPSLGSPLPPCLHMFTNREALRTQSFWVFMGASLHRQE